MGQALTMADFELAAPPMTKAPRHCSSSACSASSSTSNSWDARKGVVGYHWQLALARGAEQRSGILRIGAAANIVRWSLPPGSGLCRVFGADALAAIHSW